MDVAYYKGGVIIILPYGHGPEADVLWVQDRDGNIICGHDHYWFEDDGSIGYADHHDYDTSGWPVAGCELPHDRPVLDGVYLPDDVWEQARPW